MSKYVAHMDASRLRQLTVWDENSLVISSDIRFPFLRAGRGKKPDCFQIGFTFYASRTK